MIEKSHRRTLTVGLDRKTNEYDRKSINVTGFSSISYKLERVNMTQKIFRSYSYLEVGCLSGIF